MVTYNKKKLFLAFGLVIVHLSENRKIAGWLCPNLTNQILFEKVGIIDDQMMKIDHPSKLNFNKPNQAFVLSE